MRIRHDHFRKKKKQIDPEIIIDHCCQHQGQEFAIDRVISYVSNTPANVYDPSYNMGHQDNDEPIHTRDEDEDDASIMCATYDEDPTYVATKKWGALRSIENSTEKGFCHETYLPLDAFDQVLEEFQHNHERRKVLDLGSGSSRVCLELALKGYRDIIGVDIREMAITYQRQLCARLHQVSFYCLDLLQSWSMFQSEAFHLVLAKATLDRICFTSGMEKTTTTTTMLLELHRTLRTGGLLVIITGRKPREYQDLFAQVFQETEEELGFELELVQALGVPEGSYHVHQRPFHTLVYRKMKMKMTIDPVDPIIDHPRKIRRPKAKVHHDQNTRTRVLHHVHKSIQQEQERERQARIHLRAEELSSQIVARELLYCQDRAFLFAQGKRHKLDKQHIRQHIVLDWIWNQVWASIEQKACENRYTAQLLSRQIILDVLLSCLSDATQVGAAAAADDDTQLHTCPHESAQNKDDLEIQNILWTIVQAIEMKTSASGSSSTASAAAVAVAKTDLLGLGSHTKICVVESSASLMNKLKTDTNEQEQLNHVVADMLSLMIQTIETDMNR